MRQYVAVMVLAALAFGLRADVARAQMPTVTETYDIDPAPCDGLDLNGIDYAFSVGGAPNLDCEAGTGAGPVSTNNISAPNIEGTADGVLTLTFEVPTTRFSFGVAQNAVGAPQTVSISLFRPGAGLLRDSVSLTTTEDPYFVGGHYMYDGPAVKTVSISFSNAGDRFAVDNVTYFRPPGTSE
jgi:hypothetical protein